MARYSFREAYGFQAWWDLIALNSMMKHVEHVVPYTFVPALKLLTDRDDVDQAFDRMKAQRESISFWDSPREKWRKKYSQFVRELDWVSGELKKHLPPEEYQAFIIDNVAQGIESWIGFLKPQFKKFLSSNTDASTTNSSAAPAQKTGTEPAAQSRMERWVQNFFAGDLALKMFNSVNVASFLVGPMRFTEVSKDGMEAYISNCAMHTVVSDQVPSEEACMLGCKGACEKAFGDDSPVKLYFEPQLPNFDCKMTVKWSEDETTDASKPASTSVKMAS